ncbi:MAG: hypothetical protein MJZ41_15610, partial [Bacteroidaceae bacterium]|nr:hypothetical protein [Bacteroidaceae bacterium]
RAASIYDCLHVSLFASYYSCLKLQKMDDYCRKNGYDLKFIGHSQGGGQAALASMVTGREAITFNSAAVSPDTKIAHGIDPNKNFNGQIKAFITESDIVNLAQDAFGAPADGERYYIKSSDGALNHHGMNAVIRDMKRMMKS